MGLRDKIAEDFKRAFYGREEMLQEIVKRLTLMDVYEENVGSYHYIEAETKKMADEVTDLINKARDDDGDTNYVFIDKNIGKTKKDWHNARRARVFCRSFIRLGGYAVASMDIYDILANNTDTVEYVFTAAVAVGLANFLDYLIYERTLPNNFTDKNDK